VNINDLQNMTPREINFFFPLVNLVEEEKDGLIYLASPFTHHDPWVELDRYEQVSHGLTNLVRMGFQVFCPIEHSYRVGRRLRIKQTEFWIRLDRPVLEASKRMWIYGLDGWEKSIGVRSEIEIAAPRIPIKVLEPF